MELESGVEAESLTLHSMTDLSAYHLQPEIIVGKLRGSESGYLQLESLGRGAYSNVYLAKKIESSEESKFAMKTFTHTRTVQKYDTLLYREISILRNTNHDNVIKLCDIIVDGDQRSLSLILEYCDTDLGRFLDYYPFPTLNQDQVKCIAIHLFRGLNYLHKNYIVHRDIKPSNLLISSKGVLKIADFGSARRWSLTNKPTSPEMMTIWYQAPELLFEAPEYDSKVDMWSAGCVIVEAMTRKPLFEGCNVSTTLIHRMTEILGKPQPSTWPGFTKCRVYKSIRLPGDAFNRLVDTLNRLNCTIAIPLLEGLIRYDPESRYSAETCLRLDFFQQAPLPSRTIEKPDLLPYHVLPQRAITRK